MPKRLDDEKSRKKSASLRKSIDELMQKDQLDKGRAANKPARGAASNTQGRRGEYSEG
jgi:hypothetical protein